MSEIRSWAMNWAVPLGLITLGVCVLIASLIEAWEQSDGG